MIAKGEEPIAFDHDCREGICGQCGLVINGSRTVQRATTTCQLHMRSFHDGDDLTIEPWRAAAFPVVKDLDGRPQRLRPDHRQPAASSRSAPGTLPTANAIPVPKDAADCAMDAAACIGCGACVAACPNASAMLFVAAKVAHLGLLPQGQPERDRRVIAMVDAMDAEGFGSCTNHGECEAACPKEIRLEFIARLNRDYLKATPPQASGGRNRGPP